MLPGRLTFTVLLVAMATPAATGLTVKPASRVRGHPREQLTLHCGDRQRSADAVLFWHSPFGYHHPWDPHSSLDPVSMRSDGSLVISNTSALHSGLYYCLLWHPEGTTLWQYQLHVTAFEVRQEVRFPEDGPEIGPTEEEPEYGTLDWTEVRSEVTPEEGPGQVWPEDEFEDGSEVGPPQDESDDGPQLQSGDGGTVGVSDEQFAAAVAASVLLTFMVGFSAGALARTHVLRCLAAVTKQLRLPQQQTRRPDATDHRPQVTTLTGSSAYRNQAFELGQLGQLDSTPPPAKPQRSFRYRQEEERETTTYLEACDHVRTEEEREKEESEEGRKEEQEKGRTEEGDEEEEEESEASSFSLLGDDGGSQSETEEHREKDGGRREEEDGTNREEKEGGSSEEENGGRREESDDEDETSSFSQAVDEANQTERDEKKERGEETSEEEEGGEGRGGADSNQSSEGDGDVSPPAPRLASRRRVIRLYEYDEDGRRYGHLTDPPTEAPDPAPRLKQRSLSLTRLNAIMAAATASPLDARGNGEEKPRFHMDI